MSFEFIDGQYESGKGFGYELQKQFKGKNVKNSVYTNSVIEYLNNLEQFDINEMDTGGINIGRLYFFFYQATTPGLAYYDTQPLVYITEVNYNAGYFIGANMHYLNTKHREGIAQALINKGSKCSVPRKTIHRYLFSGVAGGFMRVPEKDCLLLQCYPWRNLLIREDNHSLNTGLGTNPKWHLKKSVKNHSY